MSADEYVTKEVVEGFASLFQGGYMAKSHTDGGFFPMERPDGTHYEATGAGLHRAVEAHLLTNGEGGGVYPLIALEGLTGAPEAFVVWWGCVDWDEGMQESYVHAKNVHQVLRQLGVTGWVERSRSKGFHLWVFFTEPMMARVVREGLIGACDIVDAPTKEVNPKQVTLVGKKVGNGVRLPYHADREPGQNEVVNPLASYSQIPPHSFVAQALENRTDPAAWGAVHDLYKQNEPAPVKRTSYSYTGRRLTGMAEAIRRNGPRRTPDKPHGDRSTTLFSLACHMIRQGYRDGDIFTELKEADEDWGGKFAKRPDGDERLQNVLEAAHKEAWRNE